MQNISEREYMMYLQHLDNAQRHKRRSGDTVAYAVNWVANLARDIYARKQRTTRVLGNYVFLVSRPKWREIIGTGFDGRLCDHELCDTLEPWVERALSPRTFNNRKGKGSLMAMNRVLDDIAEVEARGEQAWVIKWDLRGFFPSARWQVVESCFMDVIGRNEDEIAKMYREDMPDYLRWLVMVIVNGNPARHLQWRMPRQVWCEHIDSEKSILTKDAGVGMPIGRLVSQMGMGLYLNDEVVWLNEVCGVRTTVFMDDAVMVVPQRMVGYALSLLPELRKRLAAKGLKLNERKFYCQPAHRGFEFLGSHYQPHRVHLNNKTYERARQRIREFNEARNKYARLDSFLSTANSYIGQLKARTDYQRLMKLVHLIDREWWQWLEWDDARKCVACKDGYKYRDRLRMKYGIKIKSLNKKQYDTAGKRRSNRRALHRKTEPRSKPHCRRLQGD